MKYAQRLRWATLASITLHAVLLAAWAAWLAPGRVGPAVAPAPIALRLQAPEPEPAHRLVDVHTPAETPPEDAEYIAEFDAVATDEALREGGDPGPMPEIEDDAAALPTLPPAADTAAPAPAPAIEPPAPAAPAPTPEPEERPAPARDAIAAAPAPETEPAPRDRIASAPSDAAERAAPAEAPGRDPPAERFHEARAQPAPEAPPRPSRGRLGAEVTREGLLGFEALQSDLAPYLQEIRRRVERRWNEALLTRYSGVTRTQAVLECVISPEGELLSVRIVETSGDRIFAGLCRDAIVRAAPFDPFPFETPDVYQSRNLEIRWTFRFL